MPSFVISPISHAPCPPLAESHVAVHVSEPSARVIFEIERLYVPPTLRHPKTRRSPPPGSCSTALAADVEDEDQTQEISPPEVSFAANAFLVELPSEASALPVMT